MYHIHPASYFSIVLAIALALIIDKWRIFDYKPLRVHDALPASYAVNSGPSTPQLRRISVNPPVTQISDTTAVILNWSRFPNVLRIATLLCDSSLNSTIAAVVVWNNSPRTLAQKDFVSALCPPGKLKIHNSPSNLYFHARFVACSQASTRYCFVQDDDYLVWPEVINALHSYISAVPSHGIHVLPPHEKLSSDLRTIRVGADIHTSFAWLGHGALIPRARAADFLALMSYLNASEEELKMADNYFSILSNTFTDIWFDQGVELAGGQPFTVGTEGEERNRRHILKATQMLKSAIATLPAPSSDGSSLRYLSKEPQLDPHVHRAPCLGSVCLLEISISLLPDAIHNVAASVDQMISLETINAELIGSERTTNYISHPPSHAVDGNPDTAFCSYDDAKSGDTIALNIFRGAGPEWQEIELVFLVDNATENILQASVFEVALEDRWMVSDSAVSCIDTAITSASPSIHGLLRECSIYFLPIRAHIFRAHLARNMKVRWCVYEIWLRGRVV